MTSAVASGEASRVGGPRTHGFGADLWAGLAAMLVALPSAIAFGVTIFAAASPSLVGAGALAGIIGAAALGVTAPLVGRNAGFITAPCAPAAAVMSGLATELAKDGHTSTERIVGLLALTGAIAALLQLVYGFARAGRVIKYIPYQVVTGYLSGVAVIIAMGQLPKLLGLPKGTALGSGLFSPSLWQWPGLVVGLVTIATMIIAQRVTKKVPAAIIGLASGVLTYFALGLFVPELLQLAGNVHVIGPIQASGSFLEGAQLRLAGITSVDLASFERVLGPALTLSALLSIDTLKTGVVLDAMTQRRHDSNRELVAQGTANAISCLAGGIPGAGTMGASLVNVTSGSKTFGSSVVEGALALLTLFALGPLVAWVPNGALAGILLVVAWRMFDLQTFKLVLTPGTRLDFLVIVAVIVVAEGVGLIQASLVGVALAIVLFIRDQIRGSIILRKNDLREVRSKRRRSEAEVELLGAHGSEGLVVQLQGNLFFGTTDQLFSELAEDLEHRRFILFDFRRVQSMDYTAGHLFHQLHARMHGRGGDLLFSGMPSSLPSRQDIQKYMKQLGLIGNGREGVEIFETRDAALEWMESKILEAAGWTPQESKPPILLAETSLFAGLAPEVIAEIEAWLPSKHYDPGATIFGCGDAGDEMFLVRKGRVHAMLPLEAGKRHHLSSFARGDFFGEMTFLDGQPRSADAIAATDTDLFVISRDTFQKRIAARPEVAAHVFARLAIAMGQRLRVTARELRALEER